ncbi:M56 family peptidase [Sesbania bispinosa]|nr:M56 family peptidase [Sesbania bispinosa]
MPKSLHHLVLGGQIIDQIASSRILLHRCRPKLMQGARVSSGSKLKFVRL